MSLEDAIMGGASSIDSTLLEGLYQLAVTGHTDEWEFERLNNAVYERLLSSYASLEVNSRSADVSNSIAG